MLVCINDLKNESICGPQQRSLMPYFVQSRRRQWTPMQRIIQRKSRLHRFRHFISSISILLFIETLNVLPVIWVLPQFTSR